MQGGCKHEWGMQMIAEANYMQGCEEPLLDDSALLTMCRNLWCLLTRPHRSDMTRVPLLLVEVRLY